MNFENMDLETILKKHFGLKRNMFLKKPKVYGEWCGTPDYRYMTKSAETAYAKLIDFIYDLDKLEKIDDVSRLVDRLDNLTIPLEV